MEIVIFLHIVVCDIMQYQIKGYLPETGHNSLKYNHQV